MAVEPDFVKKRKRKKSCGEKKLLVGKRVEVRSEEDGFLGSWHAGTVIESSKHCRHVRYDHLLIDGGDDHLVDIVPVSPIIDGTCFVNPSQCPSRGHIRPLPPPLGSGKCNLLYGLCVDVYYNEAWWEGVIFDHEDGFAERRIFFPDLGDEMTIGIDSIRITQDWDEFTEIWHHRGTWLFLELIEEYEQQSYLAVSVKQIWYDLREKNGYKKLKDWTSSVRSLWKELVLEVIDDNIKIVIDHLFHVMDLSGSSEQVRQPLLEFTRSANNFAECTEKELANSLAVVPVENPVKSDAMYLNYIRAQCVQEKSDQNKLISMSEDDAMPIMNLESDGTLHDKSVPRVVFALPSNPGGNCGISAINRGNGEQFCSSKSGKTLREFRSSKHRKIGNWQPAGPDMVPGAEFCPEAITKYAQIGKKSDKNSLIMAVRKHLKHLKWEIQSMRDEKGIFRQRYFSPDGKCYHSLRQVCLDLMDTTVKILSLKFRDDEKNLHTVPDDLDSSPPEQPQDYQDLDYCPRAMASASSDILVVEPEYNPQAVVDWYMLGEDKQRKGSLKKADMILKARQHLSALGWEFKYVISGKRTLLYCSPKGKTYYSLRSACRACLDGVVALGRSTSTYKTMENCIVSEKVEDQLASRKQSHIASNTEFHKSLIPSNALFKKLSAASCMPQTRKLKRKINSSHRRIQANSYCAGFPAFKGEDSGSLIKSRDDLGDSCHTYFLRSSKRVKQLDIPSSSNHNPRTVLSWLIDNNVILPRAKVIYCSAEKHHPKAEGRITREGIKCKCCGKLYTLSGFEYHTGSKYGNPASHIYLEDGRSLLDCQLQLLKYSNIRNFIGEPDNRLKGHHHSNENDYICSVCHYGGELILCDGCPSSFHISCLGLEGFPDGDWFCPSCCCGICGDSKFREEIEDVMDGSVLICYQCERKYHSGCIQNGGTDKSRTHAKENWFCSKKCKEIFLGLCKLLGKPIPVGVSNLTWTLVKSMQQDMVEVDVTEIEALSKLNLACSVMHECFEPVNEPYTSSDVVEDVLFSRGSMLNRLNFRGFYTILLERNEEMITVATVRVFGEKAAEVPLVGTRFQYRRLGMCRILMNVLEKKLMELGVERLILPAIPSVLNTWTTSFGFSRMSVSERLQFVDYTFLNFPDTTMCQRLLPKSRSAELKLLRGSHTELEEDIFGSGDNIDLAGSCTVSEVFQADQIEESGIVEQRLADVDVKNGITGSESSVDTVVMVHQQTHLECQPQQTKIGPKCSVVDPNFKTRWSKVSGVKCYKRRIIPGSET
ncbi:PHD zinc finger protein [Melia azedarach]|nr:PHD zinc finger protein [Melia azedarach]